MTPDLADCSDGALARLALAGRQAAYGELMRRHRDSVYRMALGSVGDADEALDVTQNSFIAAFAALDRYDGSRPFRSWIMRIALNKCHDWARRRLVRRFLTFAQPISAAEQIADTAAPIDVALADKMELARATRAIANLPPSLKEPLILRTIEGMSQAETAQVLGVSEKAVETRLYRARKKLEELLRD
ncbi:RNA polymerase sigma factor [Sphingomonas cavernae]|uniref:RNA polymerase sigma factor n=1 Tax=Sphingomonas cavernae TaxID=2320861 RepID=A0A418WRE8_9SPHN|nr:RNA polymerase sigma factor [Sphingomonas cavernae]RJF93797.1 RNA polymerase sigma factor [Sphingomonas cavernae]